MIAKEMFEELGLEVWRTNDRYIDYADEDLISIITFDSKFHSIEVNFEIGMKLLQAINQQCKELGWIE